MIRRSKYGAVRTEIDGKKFDSKGEAARYVVLRDREAAGLISNLETQVVYQLHVYGEKFRKYRADFRYVVDGVLVVEDFKSAATITDVYKMKRDIFRLEYGFPIKEVFSPAAP